MRRLVVALAAVMVLVGCAPREAAERPAPEPAEAVVESRSQRFVRARQQLDRRQYGAAAAQFEALLPVYPEMEDYTLFYLARSRGGNPAFS